MIRSFACRCTLLVLSLLAVSTGQRDYASKNYTSICFDDIATREGLANVPFPYHHLSFSSFSILKPHDPALTDIISERDLNCAVSSPNALLGSRPSENASGAYFDIANATSMKEQGLSPYFSLRSFYIKPMDAPAPGTTIYVKGYREDEEDPLLWHVDFPSGYHLPFHVQIEEYSGKPWEEMYKIEITADFGYDSLDWEFCLDNLQVQFFALLDGYDYLDDQIIFGHEKEA